MFYYRDIDECVSVYIRRGDKEVENNGRPLVANISMYFETAKKLHQMTYPNVRKSLSFLVLQMTELDFIQREPMEEE